MYAEYELDTRNGRVCRHSKIKLLNLVNYDVLAILF